jgi:hypothetical protein
MQNLYSQNIKGTIIDNNNQPIEGVTVHVLNTSLGTYSDQNGKYEIKTDLKSFQLKFSIIGMRDTILDIKSKDTIIDITLTYNESTIEGIEIVDKKITNTENSIILDIKKLDQIVSGISAEQISKSQDRSASEVLKRISGITINDNRFIMVRGLNERYNSVWLDNTIPPSTEVDRKSFSFDQIPAICINRILIYKTPSPDLPSDFAGAIIKITTQNQIEKNTLSLSIGYRQGTTFNSFQKDPTGKLDFLGIADNSRQLSNLVPVRILSNSSPERLNQIVKMFNNNWATKNITANPDLRFNTLFDVKYKKILSLFSISYSNTYQTINISRQDFGFDNSKNFLYNDTQYQVQTNINILNNNIINIKSNHKLEIKNFYNQNGIETSTLRTGNDYLAGSEVQSGSLAYLNKIIYTGQVIGTHDFKNKNDKDIIISMDWTIGYSYSKRNEPDLRRYTYTRAERSNDLFQIFIPIGSASPTNGGRFYSTTNENIVLSTINFGKIFKIKNLSITLKTGYYFENKNRNFTARVIGYVKSPNNFNNDILRNSINNVFTIDNINTNSGFIVNEITKPSDKYNTSYGVNAAYALSKLQFKKLNISGGVRFEINKQILIGKDANNVILDNTQMMPIILPSINSTYVFSDGLSTKKVNHQLKLSYGSTINRPEFREIAPFIFYDFDLNSTIMGNPNLKIANIHNYDLRYEIYDFFEKNSKSNSQITIGTFYKNFKNPIEWTILPGSGSLNRTFTFTNAPIGKTYGMEIELKKSFNFINIRVIKDLTLITNISFIKSTVHIDSTLRPMQGQSPYIINGGLFYKNDSLKLQLNINYNVIGPRIFLVGDPSYPDIIEKQRHIIDINISKQIKKFIIKFGITDVLNQYNKLIQITPSTIHEIAKWKKGSYYNLTINILI